MPSENLNTLVQKISPEYWHAQRWFGGKGRNIASAAVKDSVNLAVPAGQGILALIELSFDQGSPETYFLPLLIRVSEGPEPTSEAVLVSFEDDGHKRLIQDGLQDSNFCLELLNHLKKDANLAGRHGRFLFRKTPAFDSILGGGAASLPVSLLPAFQSNTLVEFGQRALLKCFRRLTPGINPDLEMAGFLTTYTEYRNIPLLAGVLEYETGSEKWPLASLQSFMPNQGNAWTLWNHLLQSFYERAVSTSVTELPSYQHSLELSRLLGLRTGQLHAALASRPDLPDMSPISLLKEQQQTWAKAMQREIVESLASLQRQRGSIPADWLEAADVILQGQQRLLAMAQSLAAELDWFAIRIHGDYHLGQVLVSFGDFVIIDFEGEPLRPLAERRAKQSVLKDVAGMLRSFNYAGFAALFGLGSEYRSSWTTLEAVRAQWESETRSAFLDGYRNAISKCAIALLPQSEPAVRRWLSFFELEKALYELRYELTHRPEWIPIPLGGIRQLLHGMSPL